MKKKTCFVFTILSCLALTGCGNEIPEMNSQEQAMITEYAAGLLLEYSAAYEDKMSDMSSGQSAKENETETEDNKETAAEEIENNQEAVTDASQDNKETATEENQDSQETVTAEEQAENLSDESENGTAAQIPLGDFLEAGNFSVEYAGFEVRDSYSGAQEGETAFEMTASPNTKLLVLKFQVTNQDGTEQAFNLLEKNIKATVTVSGVSKRALLTMLEDDLLTANTSVPASENRNFVIVTEYSSDVLDSIEKIQIKFAGGESQAEYVY